MILPLLLIALLLCLILSFFFSGSETAIISVNRYRLQTQAEAGDDNAIRTLKLLQKTQGLLVMVLIGTNLANVLLALLFKLFIIEAAPERADETVFLGVRMHEFLGLVVLTPIIVVFAEIIPKAVFRARADVVMTALRPAFQVIYILLWPLIHLIERFTAFVITPLQEARTEALRQITREDILELVSGENPPPGENQGDTETPTPTEQVEAEAGVALAANPEILMTEESVLSELDLSPELASERRMVQNIIELPRTTADEIMTPLVDLIAVRLKETSVERLKEIARQSGFSRFPVYRDKIINLIGYVDIYEVLRTDGNAERLEPFIEKPYYIPQSKHVDQLLQEFLQLRLKLAIVVDEFGGCIGWITLEDILEEIVGELEDELDEPEQYIQEIASGVYEVEARIEIESLNELLHTQFSEDDWETFAGILLQHFGRIPQRGDRAALNDQWLATVLQVEGQRIVKVRLERTEPPPQG